MCQSVSKHSVQSKNSEETVEANSISSDTKNSDLKLDCETELNSVSSRLLSFSSTIASLFLNITNLITVKYVEPLENVSF